MFRVTRLVDNNIVVCYDINTLQCVYFTIINVGIFTILKEDRHRSESRYRFK